MVVAAGLFVIALLPRVVGLADFLTTDEVYHWVGRVAHFAAAIERGRWADTWLTGHPGVTQMWLGTLGQWLAGVLPAQTAGVPAELGRLAQLRLPTAAAQALFVPACYLLLRRLLAPATAAIAGLLLATSPYLIAHGRLLHLDAPLTAFVTLSLLCLMAAEAAERRRAWLLASGVLAGLALLTKGPALLLLPVAGGVMALQQPAGSLVKRATGALRPYLVWLAVALVVVFALWPAMWVAPWHAVQNFFEEILSNGGRPNGDGQFFLGRAIADPGPLFYPVADLFRLTPLALAGLVAAPLAFLRRGSAPRERRALLILLGFVIYWTAVMTLGAKKFDRYVLPSWPALLIVAAAGLSALLRLVAGLVAPRARRAAWAIAGALLLALSMQPLVAYHPYYLSYYNPLLGGGPAAERALLIGWGEGMEQAGAYLRTRPDIASGRVLSALPATLQPFVPVPVEPVETYGRAPANYAVVYLESLQRGASPDVYAAIRQTLPLHSVTIHGIHYATIYQLPKPFERPLPARFGPALRLHGVTVRQSGGSITVTPSWDVRGRLEHDYLVFVHLFDTAGKRVAQIDIPPGGALPPTGAWEPGQQIAVPLPLALPPGLAGGEYRLVMGVYDPATGARLPLGDEQPADPALDGPDALLLDTLHIP